MEYQPKEPHGQEIERDPHFTLLADTDGVGFVHRGDGSARAAGLSSQHGGSAPCDGEELGWRAARIDSLGELRPFKYLTPRHFAFLARDLSPARLEGDELYPVGMRKIPLDTLAIAALCLARVFHTETPYERRNV